jgi:hypothetical protein
MRLKRRHFICLFVSSVTAGTGGGGNNGPGTDPKDTFAVTIDTATAVFPVFFITILLHPASRRIKD